LGKKKRKSRNFKETLCEGFGPNPEKEDHLIQRDTSWGQRPGEEARKKSHQSPEQGGNGIRTTEDLTLIPKRIQHKK